MKKNNALEVWKLNGGIPWNKGTHIQNNTGKTHFKKGSVAWNKGTKGVMKGWNKGLKMNDEFRKKVSEGHIKAGIIPPTRLGKKLTKEVKLKMSQLANSQPEVMRQRGLKGVRTLYLRKPTNIEVKLYSELKKRGLLFETQKIINNKFVVDAYIPSLNLIIEADGAYWHALDRVVKKDKAENAYLIKCGYKLLRIPELEINNNNFSKRLEVYLN